MEMWFGFHGEGRLLLGYLLSWMGRSRFVLTWCTSTKVSTGNTICYLQSRKPLHWLEMPKSSPNSKQVPAFGRLNSQRSRTSSLHSSHCIRDTASTACCSVESVESWWDFKELHAWSMTYSSLAATRRSKMKGWEQYSQESRRLNSHSTGKSASCADHPSSSWDRW